jgi:serine/threonine protein kinase
MGEPNLAPLPPEDRPIVERALARDPEARYSSCTEFIRALAPEGAFTNCSPTLDRLFNEKSGVRPRAQDERPTGQIAPTVSSYHSGRDTTSSPPVCSTLRETPAPDLHDFAGYRLLESVGCGPLSEIWRVKACDEAERFLKFHSSLTDGSDASEVKLLQLLSSLNHRHLLPAQVLRNKSGRIGIICDPKEGDIANRLEHYRRQGQPGIPRRELLDLLFGVADALNAIYEEHHLQHLMLSPQKLVLDRKRLLIADMGLAQIDWLPAGHPLGRLNGRYSAPELCSGKVSPTCDQYSLAVIFHELLTGLPLVRRRGSPLQLDHLPSEDREPIARALNANPSRRFGSCAELIEALDSSKPKRRSAVTAEATPVPIVLPPVISVGEKLLAPASKVVRPHPRQFIGDMLEHVTGPFHLHQTDTFSYWLQPGKLLKHSFGIGLPVQMVAAKLEGFRLQWNATLASKGPAEFRLEVPLTNSFWQRCVGRRPAILVRITLGPHRMMTESLTGVGIEMQPVDCGREQRFIGLEQHGPLLLESLRSCLGAATERRVQARLPFEHGLGVFPVLDERGLGKALLCEGKDLLPNGIGLIAPTSLPTEHVYLQPLLKSEHSGLAILGRVVRSQQHSDGRCTVGLTFAREPQTLLCPDSSPVLQGASNETD